MKPFMTHAGKIVTGARLQAALDSVADDLVALAHAIREEDAYAAHVAESVKDARLAEMLAHAAAVRKGIWNDLATWQRINAKLTGECVALLP